MGKWAGGKAAAPVKRSRVAQGFMQRSEANKARKEKDAKIRGAEFRSKVGARSAWAGGFKDKDEAARAAANMKNSLVSEAVKENEAVSDEDVQKMMKSTDQTVQQAGVRLASSRPSVFQKRFDSKGKEVTGDEKVQYDAEQAALGKYIDKDNELRAKMIKDHGGYLATSTDPSITREKNGARDAAIRAIGGKKMFELKAAQFKGLGRAAKDGHHDAQEAMLAFTPKHAEELIGTADTNLVREFRDFANQNSSLMNTETVAVLNNADKATTTKGRGSGNNRSRF